MTFKTNGTPEDINKINSLIRNKVNPEDVYIFSVTLCNNDLDKDYEKFSREALDDLADMFIGKTSGDSKARIFDTWLEKLDGKETIDGEQFYQLKAKAFILKTDENIPLITDIETGIKKEVSISCSVNSRICSICNSDSEKAICNHMPGNKYEDTIAYRILSNIGEAYEFDFVNIFTNTTTHNDKTLSKKEIVTTKLNNLLANKIYWIKINGVTVLFDHFDIDKSEVYFSKSSDRINPIFVYRNIETANSSLDDVYRALL